MTFIEPVIITVNKPTGKGSYGRFNGPQFQANKGNILDSWQKVEDQSGVTYFWNTNGNPYASPAVASVQNRPSPMSVPRTSHFTLQPPFNNSRRSSKDRGAFASNFPGGPGKDRHGGFGNNVVVVGGPGKDRPNAPVIGNNVFVNGKERQGAGAMTTANGSGVQNKNGFVKSSSAKHHHHQNGVITPRTTDPSQLIWSVSNANDQKPPVVVIKKPRTRRFLQSLLCCVSSDGTRTSGRNGLNSYSLPDHPAPQPGPYAPKPVKNPDFVIPVEIDGVIHQVYVLKRPYVDEFLQRIGDKFECVLFTASLAKYADPVADLLDKRNVFKSRLFREACVFHKGNYVKDLNRLGRDLKRVIIVDNSPASYAFHPDNAVPVQSWFDDQNDTELLEIIPLLERLSLVENVYSVLRNSNDPSPPPPLNAVNLRDVELQQQQQQNGRSSS